MPFSAHPCFPAYEFCEAFEEERFLQLGENTCQNVSVWRLARFKKTLSCQYIFIHHLGTSFSMWNFLWSQTMSSVDYSRKRKLLLVLHTLNSDSVDFIDVELHCDMF